MRPIQIHARNWNFSCWMPNVQKRLAGANPLPPRLSLCFVVWQLHLTFQCPCGRNFDPRHWNDHRNWWIRWSNINMIRLQTLYENTTGGQQVNLLSRPSNKQERLSASKSCCHGKKRPSQILNTVSLRGSKSFFCNSHQLETGHHSPPDMVQSQWISNQGFKFFTPTRFKFFFFRPKNVLPSF